MLTFDEAKARLLASASVPEGSKEGSTEDAKEHSELVRLYAALGRVLEGDIVAPVNVPPADNSAMDGFAIAYDDFLANNTLAVSQKILAGMKSAPLQQGTAVRLFTGSVIPQGADTVVLQEDCVFDDGQVTINDSTLVKGQHIRRCGEDIRQGSLLLSQGICLQAKHLGLLASVGIAEIRVRKKLRVGLLATGNELIAPGKALVEGQIYNSNLFMLQAELESLGCIVEARHAVDDLGLISRVLREFCASCDLVITIGGVSVGDADFVKQAIAELGTLELWKVSMKPGKPLSYGKILGKPIIGLPGNPVSAFATFHLFAKPYIEKMQGKSLQAIDFIHYPVHLSKPFLVAREEFLRVQLCKENGEYYLLPFPQQGSGVLRSVVWATGFARIPQDKTIVSGDRVAYIPLP